VPLTLFAAMEASPLVIFNDPFEVRIDRLQKEYCDDMITAYQAILGEEKGWVAYCNYLHHGLKGIRKRLGLEKFKVIEQILNEALNSQKSSSKTDEHRDWIGEALTGYYDPMYQYQLDMKQDRIQFSGTHQEVHEWLKDH
jgi:tRNA 2-selenouridine synthase